MGSEESVRRGYGALQFANHGLHVVMSLRGQPIGKSETLKHKISILTIEPPIDEHVNTVNETVARLLASCHGVLRTLQPLLAQEELTLRVDVVGYIVDHIPSISLDRRNVTELARIGASVVVDLQEVTQS